PCLSTVATIRKETYSIKWTLFSMIYPLATAYILALAFYQIARLIV
ncbi:ferrous iron transporter B, partial [Staphylococcus warneri]